MHTKSIIKLEKLEKAAKNTKKFNPKTKINQCGSVQSILIYLPD